MIREIPENGLFKYYSTSEHENDYPIKLSGGLFLNTLIRGFKKESKRRGKTNKGITNPNLMKMLIKLALPYYNSFGEASRFNEEVSKYIHCKVNDNSYLPFDEKAAINFNALISNNYKSELSGMHEIIQHFIDVESNSDKIVRTLIAVILNDNSIDENENFCIGFGGQPISKKQFPNLQYVYLQSFLLGVWHYIVSKKINNLDGQKYLTTILSRNSEKGSTYTLTDNIENCDKYNIRTIFKSLSYYENEKLNKFIFDNDMENIGDLSLLNTLKFSEHSNEYYILSDYEFSNYIKNGLDKYQKVKTLLYQDGNHNFRDFYTCNDLEYSHNSYSSVNREPSLSTIKEANSYSIRNIDKRIVIQGVGGLGKTMMLQHLMLDALENYNEDRKIPIFINLRNIINYNTSLYNLVSYSFSLLDEHKHDLIFDDLLKSGSFILLMDGFDEINSDIIPVFFKELNSFISSYPNNNIIISSRPSDAVNDIKNFTIVSLKPFTKKQSISLIKKLDYDKSIKDEFVKQLDHKFFESHTAFAENPLLLTIMLMSFEKFGIIQSSMHLFYQDAYSVLSQRHDALKIGFKRKYKTQTSPDEYEKYLCEFSARTYHEEKFEFSMQDIINTFNAMNIVKYNKPDFSGKDFFDDAKDTICLLHKDGLNYRFIHRSFQEYFCAEYFIKQLDENMFKIALYFENKHFRTKNDITFDMMYEMAPIKIEKYVFLPFLNEIFNNNSSENEYYNFIKKFYPILSYDIGDVKPTISYNTSVSFLYDFIKYKANFNKHISRRLFYEKNEEFLIEEFVNVYSDYKVIYNKSTNKNETIYVKDTKIISTTELTDEYIEAFGEPQIVGSSYQFEVSEIIKNPDKYNHFFEIINKDDFPIKLEYNKAKEYYLSLNNKYSNTNNSNSLFDSLI